MTEPLASDAWVRYLNGRSVSRLPFGVVHEFILSLRNIPTVFSITHRGDGCECRIYAWLIVIGVSIYTKDCRGGGGRYGGVQVGPKVIAWPLVRIPVLFNFGFARDLVGILIYTKNAACEVMPPIY